jgi:hypothetical protein
MAKREANKRKLVSRATAAFLLGGVSEDEILALIKQGRLTAIIEGKTVELDYEEVVRVQKELEEEKAAKATAYAKQQAEAKKREEEKAAAWNKLTPAEQIEQLAQAQFKKVQAQRKQHDRELAEQKAKEAKEQAIRRRVNELWEQARKNKETT